MASRLFRVGRGAVATAGGLFTAGVVDRALKPPLKPMSTATAAGAALGSVRLYQYEICPFCNKVKALLDLYKVPYDTVDVNPLTKGEIKPWSGGYKKVPIALLGGGEGTEPEQVNDSPVIAAALLERMSAGGAISKSELERFRSPKALEWAAWSDSKLAVLLFPNITRNFGEAFQAFSWYTFHDEGVDYLRADVSLKRGSPEYEAALAIALVAIFVYPVGMLVIFGLLLFRARHPPLATLPFYPAARGGRRKLSRSG